MKTNDVFRGLLPRLSALLLLHVASAAALAAPPLQNLARRHFDTQQGLLVQAEDDTVLAALNPDRAFHPASVTKVATTLAFLRQWGPAHRMRTQLSTNGPVDGNVLAGDIIIRSEGDPYFVFENAFLVLLELHALGVGRVAGDVRIEGPFFFNWSPDPRGQRLKRALAGQSGREGWSALAAHSRKAAQAGLTDIALEFQEGRAANGHGDGDLLLIHESAPLKRVLKEFNGYSNNIFHSFAGRLGGPEAVERIAQAAVPGPSRANVRIDNAAGGGRTNRLSPMTTVAILRALDRELASDALSLSDVLPVAGIDGGTLEERLRRPSYRGAVVGKTGTLPSIAVSALAGVVYTQRYGRLFFAILNQGLPVWQARKKQDAFLAELLEHAHPAPPDYRTPEAPAFTEARIRQNHR